LQHAGRPLQSAIPRQRLIPPETHSRVRVNHEGGSLNHECTSGGLFLCEEV
jgi:hypothetical protein